VIRHDANYDATDDRVTCTCGWEVRELEAKGGHGETLAMWHTMKENEHEAQHEAWLKSEEEKARTKAEEEEARAVWQAQVDAQLRSRPDRRHRFVIPPPENGRWRVIDTWHPERAFHHDSEEDARRQAHVFNATRLGNRSILEVPWLAGIAFIGLLILVAAADAVCNMLTPQCAQGFAPSC
jgi:hypothetical protein